MPRSARTVVVTGGGKGLGAAITTGFRRAGAIVYVGSRTPALPHLVRGENPAEYRRCDVRRVQDLEALATTARRETGRLDVWVNAAGFSRWRRLGGIDEPFWTEMVDTNLKGVLFGCRAAARRLGRGGVIVNVSSLAGKRGSAHNAAYCATKFGVNGITQALSKELGPQGIRVNAVCPVYVETDGLMQALNDADAPSAGRAVRAYLRAFAASQAALRRLPTAEQVAEACLFLSSPASGAITGQCINVDCGVLPQ